MSVQRKGKREKEKEVIGRERENMGVHKGSYKLFQKVVSIEPGKAGLIMCHVVKTGLQKLHKMILSRCLHLLVLY
jgi:hypothetical protein